MTTTASALGFAPVYLPNGQEVWVRRGDVAKAAGIPAGERPVSTSSLADLARTLGNAGNAVMGPGMPIPPSHTEEGDPRRYDYRPGANQQTRPRGLEDYSFETLRNFADRYDVARLCIEKRKDDLRSLTWQIRPRPIEGQTRLEAKTRRANLEGAINDATGFWLTPNQEDQWGTWLMQWAEDLFAIDAATLYLRPTLGGELFGVEVVDGATLKVVLDEWGRVPQPPQPAYIQVIRGMPWGWWSRDQMIYQPYWQRSTSPYGRPPIEWVLMTANRALRRQSLDLSRYTEGNMPFAFLRMAAEMGDQQIKEFREYLDELLAGNDAARARVIPVPGGTGTGLDHLNPEVTTEGEEWLLYITCWAFGVNPSEIGFTRSGNGLGGKGFAEVGQDLSFRRSVRNPGLHLKGILDGIMARRPGWEELELFSPELADTEDSLQKAQRDKALWDIGAKSTDQIAEENDLDPPGLGPTIVSGNAVVLLSEFLAPPKPVPAALAPFAGMNNPAAPAEGQPAGKGTENTGTAGDAVPETPSAAPGELTDGQDAGSAAQKAAAVEDLAKWERKALRSLRAKGHAMATFQPDAFALDHPFVEPIKHGLQRATTSEAVRSAFAAAREAFTKGASSSTGGASAGPFDPTTHLSPASASSSLVPSVPSMPTWYGTWPITSARQPSLSTSSSTSTGVLP